MSSQTLEVCKLPPITLSFTDMELHICLVFLKPRLRNRHSYDTELSLSCTWYIFFSSLENCVYFVASAAMVSGTMFLNPCWDFLQQNESIIS